MISTAQPQTEQYQHCRVSLGCLATVLGHKSCPVLGSGAFPPHSLQLVGMRCLLTWVTPHFVQSKITMALLKRIHSKHRTFKCSAPHFYCSRWVSACIYQVPRPLHLTCDCTPSTPMQSRCTGVPLLSPTASLWSTSSCTTPTTRSLMKCGPC